MGSLAQCVCEICTCGRHRCPHRYDSSMVKEQDKDRCLLTEYKFAYRGGPYQPPPKSMRPKRRKSTETERKKIDDMASTYDVDYTPFKVEPRVPPQKKNFYKPTPAQVDMSTTYERDYAEKKGERATPIRPKYDRFRQKSCWGVDKTCKSMYQTTYVKFSADKQKECRPTPVRAKENFIRPQEPFDATSTIQADFIKHSGAERRQPIVPKDSTKRVKGKFDGSTQYKREYTRKKMIPSVAVHPRSEYKPNTNPFHGVTTVMADYTLKDGKRPQSFKPRSAYVKSSTPFDGRSIKSIAYCAWPVTKPETPAWCKRPGYVPPKVAFAKTSSYENDYKDFPDHERVSLIRPHTNDPRNFKDGTPFDGKTTYADNFVRFHGVEIPKSFKKHVVYERPKERLIMKSEYKGQYTPQYSAPSEICRPKIRSPEPSKPMSSGTTYKCHYKGLQNAKCPVVDVNTLKHTFMKNGHKFYISEELATLDDGGCGCAAEEKEECAKNDAESEKEDCC